MNTQSDTRSVSVREAAGAWGPVILWMGVIYFLSGRSSVSVSDEYLLNFLFFKTLHLIEYATLYALSARALSLSRKERRSVFGIALLITLAYAITDELHQRFVPSRTGQPRDVIIDSLGALLSWYLLTRVLPKTPLRLRNLAKRLGLPS